MFILQNNSNGGIIRVCRGIFKTALRNKNIYIYKAFLMYVENLEMDNSLKWVLFIKVNGQITSDTLSKLCEVFLLRI